MKEALRKLLVTTLLLTLCAAGASARGGTGLEEDELKGRVRAVRVERVLWGSVGGRWKRGKRALHSEAKYDARGNRVEFSLYTNGLPMKRVYAYDAKGNLAEVSYYEFGTRPFGKEEYSYDDRGRLIEKRVSNGIRVRYEYDPKGRRVSETVADAAAGEGPRLLALTDKTAHRYDDRGNLIETSYFSSDGAKSAHSLFKAHRVEHDYDGAGRRTGTRHYAPDGSLTGRWVRHTEGGRVSTEYVDAGGRVKSRTVSVHEYDSRGNWVKRTDSVTEFGDGEAVERPTMIEYRRISYY